LPWVYFTLDEIADVLRSRVLFKVPNWFAAKKFSYKKRKGLFLAFFIPYLMGVFL
jgi:hypothetical protein